MAITVDSSQWTGEREDTPLAVPVANAVAPQAPDAAMRARAEGLLRDAGARRVFVQETRAG